MKPFYIDRLLRVVAANPDIELESCCRLAKIDAFELFIQRTGDSQLDAIIRAALERRKDHAKSTHSN